MQTVFVENTQQEPEQEPLRIPAFVVNARNVANPRIRGSSRGGQYKATDWVNGDGSTPLRSGGGNDPLKQLPQQTAEEKSADEQDTLGGSRPVGGYHGDKVKAGGPWEQQGGSNGVDRSNGEGGGDAVASGFAAPLSVQRWDSLMRNKVLARRQNQNNGLIDTAQSPSNDPNIGY